MLFLIEGPIEKEFQSDNNEFCHSKRWLWWSIPAIIIAISSLVLDFVTKRQILRNYVDARTALMGLLVDLSMLGLAIWLVVTIPNGWKE
jgi:hypothetical protein